MPFKVLKSGSPQINHASEADRDGDSQSAHASVERLSQKCINEIAAFFKNHRLSIGLSSHEVAESLGIDVQLFEAYESGEKILPLDEIFALSNCLNIPPEDVMALIYDLATIDNKTEIK